MGGVYKWIGIFDAWSGCVEWMLGRVCTCVGVWVCGCVGAWVLGVWVYGVWVHAVWMHRREGYIIQIEHVDTTSPSGKVGATVGALDGEHVGPTLGLSVGALVG